MGYFYLLIVFLNELFFVVDGLVIRVEFVDYWVKVSLFEYVLYLILFIELY